MVTFVKRDNNDLFNKPIPRFLFKNKRFLLVLRIVVAALFFYALAFGFIVQGEDNIFTGALFWGLFWSLFMVLTLPSFGRIFCGICPHGFLGKYITRFGLRKEMPKILQNRFIGVAVLVIGWWAVYYTFPGFWRSPIATASMFGGMTVIAFLFYFLYKDMGYCKSICPIGTLTRAYDKLAFTKLETYTTHCKECRTFECANACPYNLKPFTFASKNSSEDCTLCMDCAQSCESVKFSLTAPAGKLQGKFKGLGVEIWAYILILASIPISMSFAHGLDRSKIADSMLWNKTAALLGLSQYAGGFAFLYAVVFSTIAATLGIWLASKILKQDFKSTFLNLGYAYAPLFILGSLGHTLQTFFTSDSKEIIEGFAQAFGMAAEVAPLAKRGDAWLNYFELLKWIGVLWAFAILYKRLRLVDASKYKKALAYFFASFLILFFIGVNLYRSYVFTAYGAKERTSHNHGGATELFQSVPFKNATLLQEGKGKVSGIVCGMNLPMYYKTNHSAVLDGKVRQYCSLHCLTEDLFVNKLPLTDIKAVDVSSLKFIDVKDAFYVVGSSKGGTMSRTSKYAFAKKEDAQKFVQEFGGEIMDFEKALEVAKKDFMRERRGGGEKGTFEVGSRDILYFTTENPAASKSGDRQGMGHMMGGGEGGGRPSIPSKKVWLAYGKDVMTKKCLGEIKGELQAYDTKRENKNVAVSDKRGCNEISFEIPTSGYYNLYYTQSDTKEDTTYVNIAKYEFLSGRHGSSDKYSDAVKEFFSPSTQPLDLVRIKDETENSFFYRHKTGELLRFKALYQGEPLAGAEVVVQIGEGWQKRMRTSKDGIAEFHIIKDYFPEWSEFDKRHKEDFLVVLKYEENATKYALTYFDSFYPAEEEYASYSVALWMGLLSIFAAGTIIYIYRNRRVRPYKELHL